MCESHTEGLQPGNWISETDLKRLLSLIEEVRYGSITLIIQEGKVVQIEKNEKIRLV